MDSYNISSNSKCDRTLKEHGCFLDNDGGIRMEQLKYRRLQLVITKAFSIMLLKFEQELLLKEQICQQYKKDIIIFFNLH